MRALHVVTCLAGLALGVPLASRADGPRLAPAAPRVRSLPPGLWFVEGHYESYALESEPPAPRFVVTTAITTSAAAAEAASRRARERSRLDDGFPWVVTTRDVPLVGTPPDRIAVVVGLFAERAGADALAQRVAHARVLEISDTPHEPAWNERDEEERLWVVQIDPRRDAEGVSRAALEAIEQRLADAQPSSEGEYRAAYDAAVAALPRCTVRRGSLYATRASDRYHLGGRRWAPARCGGREVAVPVEATLREAVFEYRANETRVHQVTAVSCDSPNIDVWRWTPEGREVIAGEEPVFSAGCGGRS